MDNLVPWPPGKLIVALQFWPGDQAQALRLARLIADIEPVRREDVLFAFCRRYDVEMSRELWNAQIAVGQKFGVMQLRSERLGVGHPAGCNALAMGTLEQLAGTWQAGELRASSVLLIEADGCPLADDWLDILRAEHARTLASGKRVTGCLMRKPGPGEHFNGTMLVELSTWFDHPSLHRTPGNQAWDLFHAAVFGAEGRATSAMRNYYGSRDWTPGALSAVAREVAWLASVKDDSAISWAERTLTGGPNGM